MANWPNPNIFKKLFRSPESQFLLGTAAKVWSISMMVEIIVGYILYSNMRLNFYFFRSQGGRGVKEMGEAYFEHVSADIIEALPWILGYHIAIFFMGLYIGYLMLRPFRQMGEYCVKAVESPDVAYKIEDFSSYKLLTRFSEIFFETMRAARQKNKLEPRDIPPQYTGIHGPVFDASFIFHFSFFLIIVVIVSIVTIMGFAASVYENMSQLAMRTLKADPKLVSFLQDQAFLVDEMWILASILVVSLHIIMGMHLYSQVSGAAFGIFATMRSFMKGNWQSRVHLVGYSYLRDSTRSINKYLDWLQKNLSK